MLRRSFLAAIAAIPILKKCPIENTKDDFSTHIQNIEVSAILSREEIFELGSKGPYCRYIKFPVNVNVT